MTIRPAFRKDIPAVSKLHREFIKTGFLSSLGLPFLKLLYGFIAGSSNAVCLVAQDQSEIVGFISGAVNIKTFYKEFFRKRIVSTGLIIIPKLIKPSVARKVFETAFYPVKENEAFPQAELMSIVVKPEYQGKKTAPRLFDSLKNHFQSKKIRKFKVVVGSTLIPACRFYEKMGGRLAAEITIHRGETSRVYVWDFD
jgi:ribosomal protein S18 acetylase RimI-like enzyme